MEPHDKCFPVIVERRILHSCDIYADGNIHWGDVRGNFGRGGFASNRTFAVPSSTGNWLPDATRGTYGFVSTRWFLCRLVRSLSVRLGNRHPRRLARSGGRAQIQLFGPPVWVRP